MKRVFTAIIMVVAFAQIANAQSVIKNESLTRQKRTVSVSFDIETSTSKVSNMMKEVLAPYIYNGADTLWLDAVEVFGKSRYKRERQVNFINGDKDWTLSDNQVMKGSIYKYSYKCSVEPWMSEAKLNIKRSIVGCSKCDVAKRNERVAESNLYEIPHFELEKCEKHFDFGQDDLAVTFKVSKTDIDHSIFDNKETFAKILDAVDKIHNNPNYKIDKIQVSGYASPEGSVKFNTWLGENRAMALINYIIAQRPDYGLTYKNFEIVNGKENWTELRKALLESDIKNKQAVIAIIDNKDLQSETKKHQIKAIDGGRTWSTILKEIYPHLRSARYLALYYESTRDNIADVVNQANAMINDGKHTEAYDLARGVAYDQRAFNTIGVALMAQGKFDEAVAWFEKAAKFNSSAAKKNMDAIEAEYGL